MKQTRSNVWTAGALACLALGLVAGCEQDAKDAKGDKADKGDTASAAPKGDAPATGKSWEDLKAELDKAFDGVNTANAGDVDAAIEKFKAAAGPPARSEGKKDFWYAKDKGGTCMEAWTLKGGGFGSNGGDASHCK